MTTVIQDDTPNEPGFSLEVVEGKLVLVQWVKSPGLPTSTGPQPAGESLSVVGASVATVATGQIALAADVSEQLPSQAFINGVLLKASADNGTDVLIGGSGVTETADGTGNGYPLAPGESVGISVANLNALYAISTAAAVLFYTGN